MHLLIDGNNWFWVNWHGAGESCNDLFFQKLDILRSTWSFSRVVIAFDDSHLWRKQVFKAYKSKRSEKTQESLDLLQDLRVRCVDYDAETICERGNEADDILVAQSEVALQAGEKCVICSSDRDLHQCLVEGWVTQCVKLKTYMGIIDRIEFMTAKRLAEKFGVTPQQWVDFRAITGDSSDCIPGCQGLGDSAATKILSTWSSLEEYQEDPERIKLGPKTRDKLNAFIADEAGLALHRQLIRLGSSGTHGCQAGEACTTH